MRFRMWVKGSALLGMCVLLVVLAGSPSRASEDEAHQVRIGLVSSLFRDTSEALMQIIMRPFKSLLEKQTGMKGQLVSGGDAQHLGQRLKQGEVHLGIFHGVEYAWAKSRFPQLKPLLIAVNKQPFLRAHLLVRAEGAIQGIDDLKGRTIDLPTLSREHCWLFLERRCVPVGQKAEKFFARINRPRDAAYAIENVIEGTSHAAVVDDADLAAYRTQSPESFAKIRLLKQSEPFPCAVIAYQPGTLSDSLLAQFRTGMLAAKNSKQGQRMMQMCRITSFEEVPEDFDKMLDDIAKAYPPPPLK